VGGPLSAFRSAGYLGDAANMNRRTGDRSRGLCNGKEAADGTELSKLW
jgi:hypothetical protein